MKAHQPRRTAPISHRTQDTQAGLSPGGRTHGRRLTALLCSLAVVVSMAIVGTPTAHADSAPIDPTNPSSPTTVTADALPAVQIDGVVWQQTIVGNTVYVAGSFTTARPAGSPAGVNTVPRNNILAYDIRTGALINAFAPNLNGQATAITASPDGSRIYVGGSFTAVNGATVWRVAALDPSNGRLLTNFLPKMDASVRAIVATNDTVYLGGLFTGVGTTPRARLAAFRSSDGSLLDWAPAAVGGQVNGLALSPDGTKMVVGGAFTTLNGSDRPGYGLGAVDVVTGQSLPFPINNIARNGGPSGSITSLSSNSTNVYGSGYTFGRASTLEGIFSVKWSDFSTEWIQDCHGDTYSVHAQGDVIYSAGHAHYCGNIGGFPQEAPWQFTRALAFSKSATGTVTDEAHGYTNFEGNPSPSLLNWFPTILDGTFTGQSQGAWSVTGNSEYLSYGGEFPSVNGSAQQGLVRFAVRAIAPNDRGPRVSGRNFNPTVSSPAPGEVRVRWQANWDQDNKNLTYLVRRDSATIGTTQQESTFWERPGMTFTDTNLVPGRQYGYRIFALDPDGNEVRSDTVTVVVSGANPPPSAYQQTVMRDGPANLWRLGEPAGLTGFDSAGKDDLAASAGATFGIAGAINGDTNTAVTLNGTTTGILADPTRAKRPNTFSTEAWIRTTTTTGGKIIGFGNALNTLSVDVDRHVYMDNLGRLFFGVAPKGVRRTVNSTARYNDGAWHHVVATLGSNGMQLYVDGTRVAGRTDTTAGRSFDGYWRVGGDNLSSWPSIPTSRYFRGDVDEVAIYPAALSAETVKTHYDAGTTGVLLNAPPTAVFTSSAAGLTVGVDGSGSTDSDGTVTSHTWDFGDGGTGSGANATHTYAAPGSYTVRLTVADDDGASHSTTKDVTVAQTPANAPPTAAFTSSTTGLTVTVNGSGSTDSDGTVASYTWSFGDGAAATGVSASRTYAAAGTYTVRLTVTDDDGATHSTTQDVIVAPSANIAPVARFTSSTTGLTVEVNGSGSTDSDGTVASHSWAFGDGGTGSGVSASRTYASAGTYPVTLTVTDDDGATHSTTANVTVTAPPVNNVIAQDGFQRTVTGGLGAADLGGAWSLNGSASLFAVSNGTATIRMNAAGSGPSAYLNSVSSATAETSVDVGLDKVANGGGSFITLTGRRVGTAGEYRAKVKVAANGAVSLDLTRAVGTVVTTLQSRTITGLTYAVGDQLTIKVSVSGTSPTTLGAKVWKKGTTEPVAWQVTGTDTTAQLQFPGGVGLTTYVSGSSTNAPIVGRFSNLLVRNVGA